MFTADLTKTYTNVSQESSRARFCRVEIGDIVSEPGPAFDLQGS